MNVQDLLVEAKAYSNNKATDKLIEAIRILARIEVRLVRANPLLTEEEKKELIKEIT